MKRSQPRARRGPLRSAVPAALSLLCASLAPLRADIAYDTFTPDEPDLVLLRDASIEAGRLRLTPNAIGRIGDAWFADPQSVSRGFETTFGIHLNRPGDSSYFYGTDGLAFIVQNTEAASAALTQTGANGLTGAALNIKFDSWYTVPADGSASAVQVRIGTQILKTVDLAAVPGVTLDTPPPGGPPGGGPPGGFPVPTLTSRSGTAPSQVRIVYRPGFLDLWFQGVKVIDSLAVDLVAAGAVDQDGKAFVGFGASTATFANQSQFNDITNWHLTEGPLPTLIQHQFDVPNRKLTLSWESAAGRNYQVTTSTDLTTWTPVAGAEDVASQGDATSVTLDYPNQPTGFFRVEQK